MTTNFLNAGLMEGFDNNNNQNIKQNNNIVYNTQNMNHDNFDSKKSAFKANRLADAELEMYYDIVTSVNPGHFDSENLGDCTKELMQYYKKDAPFDNNAYLTDQILDDRIRKNHSQWVDEVTPWAGTASIVGASEFNAGDYIDFRGLRRPRGVAQIDPWQITEVDESQLEGNKPFTF
jgi:hypothetical protein